MLKFDEYTRHFIIYKLEKYTHIIIQEMSSKHRNYHTPKFLPCPVLRVMQIFCERNHFCVFAELFWQLVSVGNFVAVACWRFFFGAEFSHFQSKGNISSTQSCCKDFQNVLFCLPKTVTCFATFSLPPTFSGDSHLECVLCA